MLMPHTGEVSADKRRARTVERLYKKEMPVSRFGFKFLLSKF
jgi:hypothetical protein